MKQTKTPTQTAPTRVGVIQKPVASAVLKTFSVLKETIIWTALPNGRTGSKLNLSAHVSFHLSGPTEYLTLNSFKNAANWDLQKVKVFVKIGDQPERQATIVSAGQYDKTLWKKFFTETGPVKSWGYVPHKTPPPVDTFHAQGVGAYLTTIQAHQALDGFYKPSSAAEQSQNPLIKQAAVDTPPPVPPKSPAAGGIRGLAPAAALGGATASRQAHVGVINQKNAHPSILAAKNARTQGLIPNTTEHQIAEAQHYTQPSAAKLGSPRAAKPVAPKVDFHQAIAMLGQHPALMRIMGVVLDLEVDLQTMPVTHGGLKIDASRTKIAAAVTVPVTLRVEGMPHPEAADVQYPQTISLLSPTKFIAAPRPFGKISGDIVDGFMDMNPSKVQVGTLDLTGGVTKMVMFAEAVVRQAAFNNLLLPKAAAPLAAAQPANAVAPSTNDEQYPAHRTSGISVYRVNRLSIVQAIQAVSDDLHADLTKNQGGTPTPIQLYSDDLFKGWRPDVQHKNKWFSLTSRANTYQIAEKSLDTSDEGQTAAAETKDHDTSASKLSESLFTWTGWSLAAPKPGAPIDDTGQLVSNAPQTKSDFQNWAKNPANLDKNYPLGSFAKATPASLPELRFGETYSIRARAVDLAGNSLPLSANHADAGNTTHQSTQYLRHEPISSPTVLQTSPATNRGDSASVMVVRKYLGKPTTETATRVMVPPQGGENFAELHGKLDDANGHLDPAKYAIIAAVDARAKSSGPLPNVISGDVPPLPYLPDPTALGATMRSGTGFALPTLKASFYGGGKSWPDPLPGKITLAASSGSSTTATVNGTTFAFGLQPGQMIEMWLSSNTGYEWLPEFNQTWAIEQQLLEQKKSMVATIQVKAPSVAPKASAMASHTAFGVAPSKAIMAMPKAFMDLRAQRTPFVNINEAAAVAQGFVDGLNTALTPFSKVKIIHATQVPEPGYDLKRFAASRAEGKTYAGLAFAGDVHTWSTGELEFMATYVDPVDDLSEPQRKTKSQTKTNRAFTIVVPYNDPKAINLLQQIGTHEFHDTKAHLVDYVVVAKTRYQEYFPADWPKTNDPSTAFSINYPVVLPSSGGKIAAPGARAVAVGPEARPVVKNEGIYIPSSQRPDSLPLEYIVPVSLWAKGDFSGKKFSAKKGNMFRIFLRRPWFSTGIDEKLGILLGGAFNDSDPNEELTERWTTRIGSDPVFSNPPFVGAPTAANFPGHEGTANVALNELKGKQVEVLQYTPIFDDVRQMWYVDIEIKPSGKTYNPFVRLAMARFQPHSLPGLGIGPVVIADIMQLQADRLAILEVAEPKKKVVVSMAGVVGATLGMREMDSGKTSTVKNFVLATLERKTGSDPDTGWTPEYDAKGEMQEISIPFLDENLAAAIPAYIAGPKPFVKSKFAPAQAVEAPAASLKAQVITASQAERAGTINLPDPNATYRVVLREYEQHGFFPIDAELTKEKNPGRKLVHVDVIPIS